MVWNYDKNIIFIHIPKTGGTSVESYLNLKTKDKSKFDKIGYGIKYINGKKKALQHLTVGEINDYIGNQKFNQMIKFTIVRNPFSKIVSEFSHFTNLSGPKYHGNESPLIKNGELITDFDNFLDHVDHIVNNNLYDDNIFYDHFRPQSDFVKINNKIIVDTVFKFENLNEVKYFLKIICPKDTSDFPHAQKRRKKQIKLSPDQKKKIYNIYQKDFQLFNYKFT